MRPSARLALPALAVALALAAPAGAQRASTRAAARDTVPPAPWERRGPVRFALGAGALFQSALGASGARVSGGGGFDAFGALEVSAFTLGVGYQRSTQSLPGTGAGRALYHGVFLEPRVSVATLRNFTPYVAGRVAFLRQQVPVSAQFRSTRRSLTALGTGVGTLVWLAPAVQLDLAAMYTDVRGGQDAAAAGTFFGGTGRAGVLRAGLVFELDNWRR